MGQAIIWKDDIEVFEYDGEKYGLKRKMSHGDQRQLENSYLKRADSIAKGTGDVLEPLLIMLNLQWWSLVDQAGKPIPVNSSYINMLDDTVARALLAEIDRRNTHPKELTPATSETPPPVLT